MPPVHARGRASREPFEGRDTGGFDGVNPLATDVLRRNGLKSWTKPAPSLYPHQWSWDSAFIALGLAHVDNRRATDELDTLFTGQWSTGKIPHIVFDPEAPEKSYFPDAERWNSSALSEHAPSGPRTSGLCQPPVHAIAVRRIWQTSRGKGEERVARARYFLTATTDVFSPGTVTLRPPATPKARGWLPSITPGRAARTTPRAGTPHWIGSLSGRYLPTALRPQARQRSFAPSDRQRVRPLFVAARASQAGPLRRGRYLRAAPVPGQGRPVFRHPRCGQRGSAGDLRGPEAPREDRELIEGWIERGRAGLEGQWDPDLGLCLDHDVLAGEPLKVRTIAGFAPLIAGGLARTRLCDLLGTLDSQAFAGNPRLRYRCRPPQAQKSLASTRGATGVVLFGLSPTGSYGGRCFARERVRGHRGLRRETLEEFSEGGFAEYFEPFTGEALGSRGAILDRCRRSRHARHRGHGLARFLLGSSLTHLASELPSLFGE